MKTVLQAHCFVMESVRVKEIHAPIFTLQVHCKLPDTKILFCWPYGFTSLTLNLHLQTCSKYIYLPLTVNLQLTLSSQMTVNFQLNFKLWPHIAELKLTFD